MRRLRKCKDRLGLLSFRRAIQSALDYFGDPKVATGRVTRRWARSDSLVVKTHYIRLDKQILRGDQLILDGIREGDYVEATFYPHSAVLLWVEKKDPPEEAAANLNYLRQMLAEHKDGKDKKPARRALRQAANNS